MLLCNCSQRGVARVHAMETFGVPKRWMSVGMIRSLGVVMSEELLQGWEREAEADACALCARIADAPHEGLQLDLIDEHAANGSNSLDEAFCAGVVRGEHLTDRFLAAI